MDLVSERDVVNRLLELGPFSSDTEALSALRATLEALGGSLTEDERRAIAASLPTECAHVLLGARAASCRKPDELFLTIAFREETTLARAVEQAEIVCRALGEVLSPTARARLRHALPEIEKLFETPDMEDFPVRSPHALAPDNLAEEPPGGSRRLSSANPAELAHEHSIARSDDPHAETKLSSACGLTQEREERSLATGRPGSRRPLSKSH